MTKQEILDYLDNVLHPIVSPDNWNVYSELHDMIEDLPSLDIVRCKDCGLFRRWVDTGITFCDLTESNVSENDYCSKAVERREDGEE